MVHSHDVRHMKQTRVNASCTINNPDWGTTAIVELANKI